MSGVGFVVYVLLEVHPCTGANRLMAVRLDSLGRRNWLVLLNGWYTESVLCQEAVPCCPRKVTIGRGEGKGISLNARNVINCTAQQSIALNLHFNVALMEPRSIQNYQGGG